MGAYAQGNLQFNQVLTFNEGTSQTNIYTVPAGKVAKIVKSIELWANLNSFAMFTINGKRYNPQINGGVQEWWHTHKDGMWLKPGDVIGTDVEPGILNTYENIFLSIIEYNVISP